MNETENLFGKFGKEWLAEQSKVLYSGDSRISQLLMKAIQSSQEMVIITDAPETIGEEKILFVNQAFEENTQYSREEVLGKSPSFLQGPDTDYEVIAKLVEQLQQGNRFEGETFNNRKDGSRYRVRWSIDPVRDKNGDITHFISVQRNVTKEYKRKKKLENLLEEREMLIRETHHRVKNNLSTVVGLLELQIMKSDSEKIKEVLTESMTRVQSIAAIHEKLYANEELSTLAIDKYLKELLDYVEQSMAESVESKEIELQQELESIPIKPRQAVPLGLIVNELVTNAYKHAFKGEILEEQGTIRVSCRLVGGDIQLNVEDNGKGLPDDMSLESTDSLGLSLIETISSQLDAQYRFTGENGTRFEMSFPREDPGKSDDL